jgi:hypothetical protein
VTRRSGLGVTLRIIVGAWVVFPANLITAIRVRQRKVFPKVPSHMTALLYSHLSPKRANGVEAMLFSRAAKRASDAPKRVAAEVSQSHRRLRDHDLLAD